MKHKRFLLVAVCLAMMLLGCQQEASVISEPDPETVLRVVTTYGADDGNRPAYENALAAFTKETGIAVQDHSDGASENWKLRVMTDFETGSEPDVLFFFTDADAEPLIRARKVVSMEEIRREYPGYAGNMNMEILPKASDGEHYAVPINGYWEMLYVNKGVLDRCGIPLPDMAYTWEQFLEDCRVIRAAGYTPIACSLAEVAHYWFEYAVLNNGSAEEHFRLPGVGADGALLDDGVTEKWIAGLEDIRCLYENGCFPTNTLTLGDTEAVSIFGEGKAAFLLDGSWKVGFFTKNYPDRLDQFVVCHVPGKGERTAGESIGGISSGFFITRKAWDDPKKRDAAVAFVSYMTSNETVASFVTTELTALNEPLTVSALDPLQQSAAQAVNSATQWVGAVQDRLSAKARSSLFANIQNVVSGKMTAREAVETAMQYQIS